MILGVRPHALEPASQAEAMFSGRVELIEPLGDETHAHVNLGGMVLTARLEPQVKVVKGESLRLKARPESLYFFDPDSGTALY